MNSKFHPDALAEFDEAVDFYDMESEGLGQRFQREIGAWIREIEKSPKRWPLYDEEVRSFVVSVFPFVIVYGVRGLRSRDRRHAHKSRTRLLESKAQLMSKRYSRSIFSIGSRSLPSPFTTVTRSS